MEREFFGTDGIRGRANSWPMTAEIAVRAGMAAGLQFIRGNHRHRVVVGKDTRLSGYMLEPALTAGFTSVGMDVILVGPMPTPAVAMLTRSLRADLGVVLSASHNQFADNGIKLFGPDGYKLSDLIETEIEARMQSDMSGSLAKSADLGRAMRLDDAPGRYIEAAKATFPSDRRLTDLKIVVDCANGAAYKVAPTVLWELEAEVVPIGVDPDGFNINQDCGSVHTDYMREQVVAHGADIGIALDGDADRLIVADENGQLVDGDQLMATIADAWAANGTLQGGGLVATVMSNLGLERHLSAQGLALVRTQVGDRYVVEHMRRHGFNLGGEQSGHIVMSDFGTTGDGLIAALQILALVVAQERPVSEVCRRFEAVPQLLKNVRYSGPSPLDLPRINDAIKRQRGRLGDQGRLLIRPSGTEPLIRVMAEGDDGELIHSVVDELIDLIEAAAAAN
ncbi:MAG: phosphoglucosamine mutase [Alphaproteobacteria bacterium]|nr:phosphoglucosamine mutase [Alphaproteobacteria bacterium]